MANLTLYELEGCPYCAKVKDKLADLDLEYDSVMVPRSHGERTEVEEVSGQTGVPVLVDEEHGVEGMAESDDIVEYLDETYGDAAS
ncbi:glutathione S-transferase N-terminal domain-containing protein [Halogeometricum sp. S1BR25-6]|uniref:Glutathione S-transferase N-terminal domain-containing protein n=1 Tax=Halogeometricum salsisoli TaxID=2950536 RepID=A0ABU2GA01_9EURY|nr:glutathione S-transferase N-terminal domain-containing protein [Halogeometricum sp. S1BR25-6]MDS0297607.1 glutathione S-transferase N-terminal domain-containing protein [Halogeometricum sp. S1BR25-6]